MNLQTGTPIARGRYIAYVRSDSHQTPDWCIPKFGAWHDGRWDLGVPVYAWIGPLPALKVSEAVQLDIERVEAMRAAAPKPGSDEEFMSGTEWTPEQRARVLAIMPRQEYDL